MGAAGHQIVASAFRGGLGQHRRFDVQKAVLFQELAQGADHPGAQPQPFLHYRSAQIQIAVAQPHFLGGVVIVQLERQRLGTVEDFDLAGQHFHRAGGKIEILGAFGATAHPPDHPQHKFITDPLRIGESVRHVGIDHDLHQTLTVAQVDENNATMIAAAMRPTTEGDSLIQQALGDLAAIMTAHGFWFPSGKTRMKEWQSRMRPTVKGGNSTNSDP
ncbi:hypothetical protein BN874_1520017 [Candidatus Contendobacter odensis Run_B_J11]|uniref:Uncharacterized protein n=1 Tax=Candidatus Contendobacter odensis Run_B_J11 TaxID=1400861 RepID=A0A7U7G9F5_9GAMM|nr:hypothetical protein BN874_1520017 [Candidatus Contendobacter odensis Run_B_J11]